MLTLTKEKSIIAAFHVTDEIDLCCVGFLKSELTKHSWLYKGVLAQVVDVYPGCSVTAIISCLPEETIKQMSSHQPDNTNIEES